MTISGSMPKFQRYYHGFATAFMCLAFAVLAAIGLHGIFHYRQAQAPREYFLFSAVFSAFAGFAIGAQIWFRRRIVSEISLDGSALRFQTLGVPQPETRHLSELKSLREWRGRNGWIGYRLRFRDGRKLYLEHAVTNSAAIASEIRATLGLR